MRGVEKIHYKKNIIAIVFRRYLSVVDLKFFTNDRNPLQVGIHQRKSGIRLSPHIHRLDNPQIIREVQEVLIVQEGKIRVTLYTKSGKIIGKKILHQGDSILLMKEGHGVDLLEKSKIFEIKQGPYPGTHHAKIYFHS